VTPLKSQTDFTSPFSAFKGKIKHKYFNGKYPHTIQVLEAEKSWGLRRPHLKLILATFEATISANTMLFVNRVYTVPKPMNSFQVDLEMQK
jgi:hypothetical protein